MLGCGWTFTKWGLVTSNVYQSTHNNQKLFVHLWSTSGGFSGCFLTCRLFTRVSASWWVCKLVAFPCACFSVTERSACECITTNHVTAFSLRLATCGWGGSSKSKYSLHELCSGSVDEGETQPVVPIRGSFIHVVATVCGLCHIPDYKTYLDT